MVAVTWGIKATIIKRSLYTCPVLFWLDPFNYRAAKSKTGLIFPQQTPYKNVLVLPVLTLIEVINPEDLEESPPPSDVKEKVENQKSEDNVEVQKVEENKEIRSEFF